MTNIKINNGLANIGILGFHLLYLLFLINTNLSKPQYILAYNVVLIFIFIKTYLINLKIVLPFFILSLIAFFCSIFKNDDISIFINIAYFFSLSIIVLLYRVYRINNSIHLFLMICYFLFIIFKLASGYDPNFILDNKSQNMVSFYFMLFVILFYIYDNRKGSLLISLLPSIFMVVLSLLMYGRSGIIVSIVLLLGVFYFYLRSSSIFKKILIYLIGLLIAVYFTLSFSGFIEEGLSRFNREGTSLTGRAELWSTYFSLIENNFTFFFIGVPLDADYLFVRYDRNFHNSFLSLHSYLGVFSMAFLLYVLFCLFNQKNDLFLRFLLLVLLVRGFSDQLFFLNFNDYIIFLILSFFAFKSKKALFNS